MADGGSPSSGGSPPHPFELSGTREGGDTVPGTDAFDDALPPTHDGDPGSFVDLASSAVESLREGDVEDSGRAMIVGLLVGAAIGLVIDALLSQVVFSPW